MNRIILIGNGFDLAHGLPTSYRKQHSIHITMPTLMKMSIKPMCQRVSIVTQAVVKGIHSGTFGTDIIQQRIIRSSKLQ